MPPKTLFNPFPGLRPFEPDEDHLFFGREKETDELLRRLRSHRFLSVVGTSGSGKSSLVRSGLIPSLHSGFMVSAGSSWRVSVLRPGEDPIGHLAEALDAPNVLGNPDAALASTNRVLLDATLRRGTLGLVDAIRLARISPHDNVLILVDQFEELFRFRRKRQIENSRDEAVAFVKLLLEAANQNDVPIYIVLTMRSDFIGDCMDYPGLPHAVNEGQYLVPRMTRDELRSAITGPVAVGGGTIAPRLVLRLLNDAGDDQDQLPLVQHVLMRTWDHWVQHQQPGESIDLANYEAVGTLRDALSQHAEEAFQETGSEDQQQITERIFKALTDTFSDPRGVRRPTSVADLAAICEASEASVIDIVEIFRRPGRSFLMPPASVPLTAPVIVDLSHESLMRCWPRLIAWAQEERTAAAIYLRLSREASWHREGAAGLWSDPELEIGLRWKRDNQPSAAWARRYDEAFDRAMHYLDLSEQERDRQRAERRARRVRYLAVAWGSAAVLLVLLVVVSYLAQSAARQRTLAESNLRLAESNLRVANDAVNQTLAVTDRQPELVAAEPPETQALRRELLERARVFYLVFVNREPTNEMFLFERADAHFRLGHIYRVLGDPQQAESEYKVAIRQFDSLTRSPSAKPEYRQSLANAYNWLGETLRPLGDRRADAECANGNALPLQNALNGASPANVDYKQELARTHYNRGILYGSSAGVGDPSFNQAEADFRDAIALLQPLAQGKADVQVLQDLARADNNLASLLEQDTQNASRTGEARALYERAIQIHEDLVAKQPRNREYKLELAKFSDNLAYLLGELGEVDLATRITSRALALMDELARPTASLGIEHADAHNLRARILQSRRSKTAVDDYREALQLYEEVEKAIDPGSLNEFHHRFGEFLQNLASLTQEQPANDAARRVLSDAMTFYTARGNAAVASGSRAEAQTVLANLSQVMPQLLERDRRAFASVLKELQLAVDKQSLTGK
jgi:hypothetical protein